jgi:hypothetical protein
MVDHHPHRDVAHFQPRMHGLGTTEPVVPGAADDGHFVRRPEPGRAESQWNRSSSYCNVGLPRSSAGARRRQLLR